MLLKNNLNERNQKASIELFLAEIAAVLMIFFENNIFSLFCSFQRIQKIEAYKFKSSVFFSMNISIIHRLASWYLLSLIEFFENSFVRSQNILHFQLNI